MDPRPLRRGARPVRPLLNLVHQLRRQALRLLRIQTRGVRVMVFNASGEVLLIRHSYGRSDLFRFPGGGIRAWERPDQAARREIKEETGCTLAELSFTSTHVTDLEGRRDTVHLFKALTRDEPVADGMEVEEAGFFRLDDLPSPMSPAAMRRIEEHLNRRTADGRW